MAYRNKEKERETRKRYYWKHIESERIKARDSKRRARAAHGDEINKRQRASYRKNLASNREKIYTNRVRREPWRGIRSAITALESGNLSLAEFNQLLDNRLALANAQDPQARRKLEQCLRSANSNHSEHGRPCNRRSDKSKSKSDETRPRSLCGRPTKKEKTCEKTKLMK